MKYLLLFTLVAVVVPFRTHAMPTGRQPNAGVQLAQEFEQESNEDSGGGDGAPLLNATQTAPSSQSQAGNLNTTPTVNANSETNTASEQPLPAETTAQPTVQTPAPVISTTFPWAWVVTRTAGIASFILLALTTIIGISITTGLMFRFFSPATAWSIHRAIGTVLLISVLLHISSMLFDKFINLRLYDILVPFGSFYRTTLAALGTLGFYLMLAIVGTSLYTMTKYAKFWRLLHYFGFVMFVLLFLHGVLIGTDTKIWWMKVIYWSSAFAVTGFGMYRLVWKFRKPVI